MSHYKSPLWAAFCFGGENIEKELKRIADELKLIRIELQKANQPLTEKQQPMTYDEMVANAGDRVTIK